MRHCSSTHTLLVLVLFCACTPDHVEHATKTNVDQLIHLYRTTQVTDPELKANLDQLVENAEYAPDDGSVFGILGMNSDANGLRKLSLRAYRRAIELEPDKFDWQYLYALKLRQNGNLKQAIEHAEAALKLNPQYPALHFHLGLWYLDAGNYDNADESLTYAVSLGVGPAASAALARAKLKLGNQVQAHAIAIEIVETTSHPVAIRVLAETLRAIGEESKARELLVKASGSEPIWFPDPVHDQVTLLTKGKNRRLAVIQGMLRRGQHDTAIESLMKLESEYTKDLGVQYHLGLAYIQLQQFERAHSFLEKAVEIEPLHYPSLLLLASNYQRLGDNKNAAARLEEVTRIYPDLQIAHQELGFVRLGLADNSNALRSFERAIELDSVQPQVHYLSGLLHGEQGRCDQAIGHFENTLLIDPTFNKAQQAKESCLNSIRQSKR